MNLLPRKSAGLWLACPSVLGCGDTELCGKGDWRREVTASWKPGDRNTPTEGPRQDLTCFQPASTSRKFLSWFNKANYPLMKARLSRFSHLSMIGSIFWEPSCLFVCCLLRQGFSVAFEPVLELNLVDQAGLKLPEIRQPLPPECWD